MIFFRKFSKDGHGDAPREQDATSGSCPDLPRRRLHGWRAIALVFAFAVPADLAAGAEKVQQTKTFRDWMIGCDNTRRCTAIGLTAGRDASGYVVVKRDGAGPAQVELSLVVRTDEVIRSPVEMEILMNGAPALSQLSYPAAADPNESSTVRLELRGETAHDLAHDFRDGKTLELHAKGPGRTAATAKISLAGAAAAFLYMDVDQFRTGTETTLVGEGYHPASAVPPAPVAPILQAKVMQDVQPPPGSPPAGVAPNLDDCMGELPQPQLIRLAAGIDLWGMCYVKAHYTLLRRYWIVERGQAKPAAFVIPGREPPENGPDVLANAELAQDGHVLEAMSMGRGIGDCGSYAQWVWTGSAFQLAHLAEMPDCRGVRVEDWPVLYTTQWK